MAELSTIALLAVDVGALAFATLITVVSIRAYRRTGSATYRMTSAGFLVLTAGVFAETVLMKFGWVGLATAHALESFLFAVGFGLLYLSIRAR